MEGLWLEDLWAGARSGGRGDQGAATSRESITTLAGFGRAGSEAAHMAIPLAADSAPVVGVLLVAKADTKRTARTGAGAAAGARA